MALSKVTYVDGVTIIGAKNLNDIQDEIIAQGNQQAADEAELALKANTADVQTALALKADKSDTYTKAEVNEALGLKANTADVNEALALKADKTETYTKAQVDSMIQEAVEEAVKESEYSNFEMKSVSGDFIHITDGAGLIPVKDLKIGIDAVQDLHGYDAPWVGGAGANKFDGQTEDGKINLTTGEPSADGAFIRSVNYCACLPETTYYGFASNSPSSFVLTFYDSDKSYIGYKATSDVRNKEFTTPANAYFFKLYVTKDANSTIAINYPSTVTTYTPYANICPISGWTGAEVSVDGKNLFDADSLYTVATAQGNRNGFVLKKAGSYAVKAYKSYGEAYLYARIKYADGTWSDISRSYIVVNGTPHDGDIFEIADGDELIVYDAINNTLSTSITLFKNTEFQVAYSSAQLSDYHAYDGHVYSVTWEEAGTVYGGTLDVTTGELTVTHGILDLGTPAYAKSSNNYQFSGSVYNIKPSQSLSVATTAICSAYRAIPWNGTAVTGDFAIYDRGSVTVSFRNSQIATAADFKESMSGQTLVFELATPQTYQLTPTEVLTLLGENNIFADTGAVEELIYRISRQ